MSTYTNNFRNSFTFVTKDNGNIEWRGDFTNTREKDSTDPNADPNTVIKISAGGSAPTIEVGDDMADYSLIGTVTGFIRTDYGWEIETE